MTLRVLIAWEHGHHLGHLSRLMAVATELRRQGAWVAWALPPDRVQAAAMASAAGYEVRSAPTAHVLAVAEPMESYVDILNALGFADIDVLIARVRQWMQLMQACRIDHVVLDYAPTAQLAALLDGIPTTQITNGFDAPPSACPPFGLGMRGPFIDERNERRRLALSARVALVARQVTGGRGTSLTEMLQYPKRWLDCISQTDPYAHARQVGQAAIYIGPQGSPVEAVQARWPSGSAPPSSTPTRLRH